MTVWETFSQGLTVTGLGMGLVFLTLIVVMLAIKGLDAAFRPAAKPKATASAMAVAPAPVASVPAATNEVEDEVAAIALAIALASQKTRSVAAPISSMAYASPFDIDYDAEVQGEVITVVQIDSGPGTWGDYGRSKVME